MVLLFVHRYYCTRLKSRNHIFHIRSDRSVADADSSAPWGEDIAKVSSHDSSSTQLDKQHVSISILPITSEHIPTTFVYRNLLKGACQLVRFQTANQIFMFKPRHLFRNHSSLFFNLSGRGAWLCQVHNRANHQTWLRWCFVCVFCDFKVKQRTELYRRQPQT